MTTTPSPQRLDGNTANFSPGRRAGDFLFVSGQASVDESGAIVQGTLAEEMQRSISNLERALANHGATLRDVVKVTSYVQDPDDIAEYNRLYRQYFSDPLPARTTIANCLNDQLKFEIDAIAYLPTNGRSASTESQNL